MEVGWGCAVVEFGMWITFRSEEPAGRQRYVGSVVRRRVLRVAILFFVGCRRDACATWLTEAN